MSEIIDYYERYHKEHGDSGYTMSRVKDTSRVRFLQEYITKITPKGGSVLDIGCGDMYLSTVLPDYRWVGLDVAPDASNNKAVKHDIEKTPYPLETGAFDTVVCSEVLEHLWDLRKVHREARRLLKPGGHYIISTPNFDHVDYLLTHYRGLLFNSDESHHFEHIRQYNYDVHVRYLREAGFTPVEHVGADAHFSHFFQQARKVLAAELKTQDLAYVDQILGKCFPLYSHTILIVSRLAR